MLLAVTTKTKSQMIASLLLRHDGCTIRDVLTAIDWPSVSIPRHARSNGLRLRIEKVPGQPKRYFGERRKIEVRKVVRPWAAE
jgi:hypothetical protein